MIKLHLGCGKRNFGPDWLNIDGGDYKHLYSNDVTQLPIGNDEVDYIYASHLIEYFDREEVISLLAEWRRVLKEGGILRVAVPDFEAMVNLYVKEKFDLSNFLGPLYGKMKMDSQTIYHKTVYDLESLKVLLLTSGFSRVKRYDWRYTEHRDFDDHSQAYLPKMNKEHGTLISLNVQCRK